MKIRSILRTGGNVNNSDNDGLLYVNANNSLANANWNRAFRDIETNPLYTAEYPSEGTQVIWVRAGHGRLSELTLVSAALRSLKGKIKKCCKALMSRGNSESGSFGE